MKKVLLGAAIMLSVGLIVSRSAHAPTATTTLDVSATADPVCTVFTTPVDFGQYDDTNGNVATGDITVTCPLDVSYDITLDQGQHYSGYRHVSDGLHWLTYILWDPGHSYEWGDSGYGNTYPNGSSVSDVGDGTPQSHIVNAELLPEQGPVPDGIYSDTVAVTVYY